MSNPPAIYIDADACPVKDEVYKVARRYAVRVVVVANAALRVPADPLVELVVRPGFGAARGKRPELFVTTLALRCSQSGSTSKPAISAPGRAGGDGPGPGSSPHVTPGRGAFPAPSPAATECSSTGRNAGDPLDARPGRSDRQQSQKLSQSWIRQYVAHLGVT